MATDGKVKIGTELDKSGAQKGLSELGNFAKKGFSVIATSAKAATAAVGATAAGLGVLAKQAIENYADYEQLVGGVETLFKESQDIVIGYADQAYKTAGMSANAYMETVTSFSASLLQSLDQDTKAAADKANQALVDMSDNANKMGSDMESIQNAYQGFAKQNYTMLDNLKLGYGGTKEEMQRLLDDASKLSGIKYDISSFADIVDAIHVVQTEMEITGTTAAEASSTISGSIGMAKAAWTNFMTGMADENSDFEGLLDNLIESALTVVDNLAPRIAATLPRLVTGLGELIGQLGGYIPDLVEQLLPALVSGATTLLDELSTNLPGLLSQLLPPLVSGISTVLGSLLDMLPQLASLGGQVVEVIFSGIVQLLPQLGDAGAQLVQMLYDGIISGIPVLFSAGADLLNNLSVGLDTKIPELISKALDMIQTFATTLAQNAPILIQAGINFITQLATGIVNSIPILIEKLPTIISTFANIINDNAPTILQAGFHLIQTLATGILNAIPVLIANIPQIITAIVDVWEAMDWIGLGKNAITAIKNGIVSMVGAVKSAGQSILKGITGVLQALPGQLANFGRNAISNLGGAIKGGLSSVKGAAKSILTGIVNTFKPSALLEVGKNLIKGLWNGISDMTGWIIGKLQEFGNSVLDGIKKFFGIHSPSQRMKEEVGKPIAEGTAEGMTDNLDVVEEAADQMGEVVLEAGEETKDALDGQKEESLQAEETYWAEMIAATQRGALGQKDALEDLIDPKKDLLTNVTALFNNYITELQNVTDELMNSTGLFDEVTEKTKINSDDLMKNLQEQVNAYGEYWAVMQQLRERITNEGLRAAIEEMGIDSLGELQALNSMTDEELAQYAALYDQKYALCNMIAADSLSQLRADTETKLAQMLGVTSVNLGEFSATFDGTLASIESYVDRTVTNVGALEDDMYRNGEQIMDGLIGGMEAKKRDLKDTVEEIIDLAAEAAEAAAQINSPSHLFRDRIGKNITDGISEGMMMQADELANNARRLMDQTANATAAAAPGFVMRMRGQIEQPDLSAENDNPWKRPKWQDLPENSSNPPRVILEKGSIRVTAQIDGKDAAVAMAPYMDTELGSLADQKGRGL